MNHLADYAGPEAARLYRYHRQNGHKPREALQRTCADALANVNRYPREAISIGAPFNGGLRWIDGISRVGLRFVGFADELVDGRAINHTGWYQDSEGAMETLRGAVYRLPGRNGRARYVAGYREGSSRGGRSWSDMNPDSAAVDLSEIFTEDGDVAADRDHYGAHRDAAYRADQHAERMAEQQREYNDAWQAARRWSEAGDEMKKERAAARQLVRDMRTALRSGITAAPSICNALRMALRTHAREWEDLRQERAKLSDEFHHWEDGRSVSIADFATEQGF